MEWHHIVDPEDKLLDELAVRYKLHQLHIEDCRHRNQSAKIEFLEDYLFVVLKPVKMDEECVIEATDLDMFVGKDYLITVQEGVCSPLDGILERLRPAASRLSTGEMFHKVFDGIVDMYLPVTDRIGERIDVLEELALNSPKTSTMEELFTLRRVLIELRRILANSRDVAGHILRTEYPQIGPELQPFFRDVYDHTARNLDIIEVQRDLITGTTELYLSSVANQTNQVMKIMTVIGTIATPAIIITGIYGMNVKSLPFAENPHASGIVLLGIVGVSALMLLTLKKMNWL